ncbi:hypothetical protein [Streptomyces sp. IBSBF 2435]|uniref:hypothetical protein n=1 Tax=Streptomyces sp. IBSBF 2435 TaxID=2903531 RepID=UPI002FDBCEF8
MSLRSHTRATATLFATAALAVGGVMAGAGSAQAATAVHCTTGFGVLGSIYNFTAVGCGSFTDTGGPYTVEVDQLSAIGFFPGPFGPPVYNYGHQTVTCQAFAAGDNGLYGASGCTLN